MTTSISSDPELFFLTLVACSQENIPTQTSVHVDRDSYILLTAFQGSPLTHTMSCLVM